MPAFLKRQGCFLVTLHFSYWGNFSEVQDFKSNVSRTFWDPKFESNVLSQAFPSNSSKSTREDQNLKMLPERQVHQDSQFIKFKAVSSRNSKTKFIKHFGSRFFIQDELHLQCSTLLGWSAANASFNWPLATRLPVRKWFSSQILIPQKDCKDSKFTFLTKIH